MLRVILACLMMAAPAYAKGEKAGDFDFYVLALSWTPSWCAFEGDKRKSPQCDPIKDFGFTLHGLWPQYERGWPSFCPSNYRPPSKSVTAGMADIMGTSGLAWHQWRKHGVCSGVNPRDYYNLSRKAYEKINRPAVFRKLEEITSPDKPVINIPLNVVEDAFLDANPTLKPDQILITCKAGRVQEARICLSKDLEFRSCRLGDIERNDPCGPKPFEMAPIR